MRNGKIQREIPSIKRHRLWTSTQIGPSFPNKSRKGSERWKAGGGPSWAEWEVIKASREGNWAAGPIAGGWTVLAVPKCLQGRMLAGAHRNLFGQATLAHLRCPSRAGAFSALKMSSLARDSLWAEKSHCSTSEKKTTLKNCSGHQKWAHFSCVVPWAHKTVSEFQKDSIVDGSFVAISNRKWG